MHFLIPFFVGAGAGSNLLIKKIYCLLKINQIF